MRVLAASLLLAAGLARAERVTLPLDGEWQIEDSKAPDAVPSSWRHTVPVPGLADLSSPAFPDVDRFDSNETIARRIRSGRLPQSALVHSAGIPRQDRNWFWYRRTFRVPARKAVAILRINKAQFSTAVWLNGRKIGEHPGCFSAGLFDLSSAIDWTGENQLIVRIGAHPGVLPADFPAGTDFEKNRWTPGIYDSVSLQLADNPVIETVQVAPRLRTSDVLVQTVLKNYGARAVTCRLSQAVKTWKEGREAGRAPTHTVTLAPGEVRTIDQTVPLPGAQLWSPEHPFLYTLETGTGGDSLSTRFGMREFRFDTPTRRAFLNGRPYFLRGSNVTFHRFIEDPQAGGLAWDEPWVRKLLVDIPKRMSWNAFRFCIGPVPDKWLEIADEAGLLIQNEYFIWTGGANWYPGYARKWNPDVLIGQYKEWMRDNWNHPSLVVWDANNESADDIFERRIIPAVRGFDLSNRPWENSYNVPVGPEDPVEDHPYLFSRNWSSDGKGFDMTELEHMTGTGRIGGTPSGHAQILNEYGWLWLLRDGTPTELTARVYDRLLGPNAKPQDRLALDGYLVGGLTEFWRAHRNYAGILHFVYLTSCYPGAYTCDHFQDLKSLTLEPNFADYVREAFRPLGVYVNFWQPVLKAGDRRRYTVMMVNDRYEDASGRLELSFEGAGRVETPFSIPGLGQQTYVLDLDAPSSPGNYVLKAAAWPNGGGEPTLSRRKVRVDGK